VKGFAAKRDLHRNAQIFTEKQKQTSCQVFASRLLCGQIEPGSLKNFAAQLKEGAEAARRLRPRFFCGAVCESARTLYPPGTDSGPRCRAARAPARHYEGNERWLRFCDPRTKSRSASIRSAMESPTFLFYQMTIRPTYARAARHRESMKISKDTLACCRNCPPGIDLHSASQVSTENG